MPLGPYSLNLLSTLQPAVQPIFKSFLDACEAAGIPCQVAQGTRTFDQQQVVYDQGRTTAGPVVTKAKPGDSYHQYGLAVDVVPTAYINLPNWNPSGPLWARIGAIGEGLGLTWGGRFSSPDEPHFEFEAAPLAELKAYWEKFKQIMPVDITPASGAILAIVLIAAVYWFFLRPRLEGHGLL
ncbi:MAG: M15 family metallopeptidase [Gaiellaceae bacterium]